MTRSKRVLVVDGSAEHGESARRILAGGHQVALTTCVPAARALLDAEEFDVLIADIRVAGGGVRALIETADAPHAGPAVLVSSSGGTLEEFVAFLRMGVCDYVFKPYDAGLLERAVTRAVEVRRLRADNNRLRSALRPGQALRQLVGHGSAMSAVKEQILLVGAADTTVLITGESGTGKELVARALHELNPRRSAGFVPVNCGAFSPHVLESELFGHVKGAFTGAERSRAGRFEEAGGGTLFLDEVGTMPEAVQVRLLRVLGQREITRVGEDRPRRVDVRIVAATSADLWAMVRSGRFREDLYHRMKVFPIRLPTLAERREDVPALALTFLQRCCARLGRPAKALGAKALARLERHDWPGNVRELENVIERAVILAGDGQEIEPEDLVLGAMSRPRPKVRELPVGGTDLPRLLATLEGELIARALDLAGENRQRAARLLGLRRTTLVQKLKRRQDRARRGA